MKKLTESLERRWNFPCAPIRRELDFLLLDGWTWKRLRPYVYCRGHTNHSTIRRSGVCVLRPAHRFGVNGFPNNLVTRAILPACRSADRIVCVTYFGLSKCTECNSAQTVPTKIWASMRSRSRSASSDTQIVARRNFRCGSNSKCLPIRFSCKSSLIAL